jgi:hypothetical protein
MIAAREIGVSGQKGAVASRFHREVPPFPLAGGKGLGIEDRYLIAIALGGEPMPPGELSGALVRNIS